MSKMKEYLADVTDALNSAVTGENFEDDDAYSLTSPFVCKVADHLMKLGYTKPNSDIRRSHGFSSGPSGINPINGHYFRKVQYHDLSQEYKEVILHSECPHALAAAVEKVLVELPPKRKRRKRCS